MAYEARSRAPVLEALVTVTPAQLAILKDGGFDNAGYWGEQPDADKDFFKSFKSEIKDHYLFAQGMRCCYCSFELANDQSTFDADHILDKSTHPQFMFELNNLAAACKPCNRAKSNKTALNQNAVDDVVPVDSASYRIVHPHLDEWGTHLEFDDLNRIVPSGGSQKGKKTIEVCKISTVNAARLSQYFAPDRKTAENRLRAFYQYKNRNKKKACLEVLRVLANQYGLAQATAILDLLEQEMGNRAAP